MARHIKWRSRILGGSKPDFTRSPNILRYATGMEGGDENFDSKLGYKHCVRNTAIRYPIFPSRNSFCVILEEVKHGSTVCIHPFHAPKRDKVPLGVLEAFVFEYKRGRGSSFFKAVRYSKRWYFSYVA
ncbi:hypothetical protein TNCV_3194151 [Trichonephila clavipes]|uniref:Uncharacterized protein n=1 Tax=Trichonephila clavipes TaxID=2585209 RepID=A0A8X6RJM4_TRICX|nr:hypothetical protein TNCV_3194151 [Trichonephila clavipes]